MFHPAPWATYRKWDFTVTLYSQSSEDQMDVSHGNCRAHIPHQLSDRPSVALILYIFKVNSFLLESAERREPQKDVSYCSELWNHAICISQMDLRYLKQFLVPNTWWELT